MQNSKEKYQTAQGACRNRGGFCSSDQADCLPSMHGNNSDPTIRMLQELVASFRAQHLESRLRKGTNGFFSGKPPEGGS